MTTGSPQSGRGLFEGVARTIGATRFGGVVVFLSRKAANGRSLVGISPISNRQFFS